MQNGVVNQSGNPFEIIGLTVVSGGIRLSGDGVTVYQFQNLAFNLSVSKELLDMHKIINNRLDDIKATIMDMINNGLNIEQIVSDAAEKVIREKLK